MAEKLNPKQETFCWNYASIESETFSKKGKSAEKAGYKSFTNSATQLLANPAVQARIREIQEKNYVDNRSNCLSKFEYVWNKAISKNDLANANIAAKHFAQACGVLPASDIGRTAEQTKLDAQQVQEAKEYAKWRLLRGLGDQAEVEEPIEAVG